MFKDQDIKPIEKLAELSEIPEMGNLIGFFDLMITIDRRINPERYD